ncbi:MAG: phenylalanine--tRNA ligase subunit alpha [Myxococcales bacterium]|nr:phenylalanine--tRNA ligase subunit alpha [Myxococcales bacterium]MCB9702693.1 phenylalanine--tRNA ligase subunit alpha [Myxococcales bacterium]
MLVRLQAEQERLLAALAEVADEDALYQLQVAYLGKKGSITALSKELGRVSPDERKRLGAELNRAKAAITEALEGRREALLAEARARDLARVEDLTMPPRRPPFGTLHPLTIARRALIQTFRRMGFDVAEGPHVEHANYNFDALNFQPDHPARDMQDTFGVRDRRGAGDLVLRTHTSPVQIRAMLQRTPPVRIIAPGTVFRCDDDATHSPMFHQIEGLYVDRGVTMADLKATMIQFTAAFFGRALDIRLRPSYFPFVEPGAELDMQCPFCGRARGQTCSVCKGAGWIELGGSGMVHPAVFEAVGVDPEVYTGWAFGFGIDRMAMLMYQIPDLRQMFDGDIRFLQSFPG